MSYAWTSVSRPHIRGQDQHRTDIRALYGSHIFKDVSRLLGKCTYDFWGRFQPHVDVCLHGERTQPTANPCGREGRIIPS